MLTYLDSTEVVRVSSANSLEFETIQFLDEKTESMNDLYGSLTVSVRKSIHESIALSYLRWCRANDSDIIDMARRMLNDATLASSEDRWETYASQKGTSPLPPTLDRVAKTIAVNLDSAGKKYVHMAARVCRLLSFRSCQGQLAKGSWYV